MAVAGRDERLGDLETDAAAQTPAGERKLGHDSDRIGTCQNHDLRTIRPLRRPAVSVNANEEEPQCHYT